MEHRFYIAYDEDGDACSFIGSVGDALVANGTIFKRDGKWRIRNADREIISERRQDLAVCDFCSARPVCFDADADDFEDAWGNISGGGWAACEMCGRLIEQGDKDGLLARVLSKAAVPGFSPMLTENQKLFWQHFKGIRRIAPTLSRTRSAHCQVLASPLPLPHPEVR